MHSIYLCTLCNISCLSCNNRRQTECKMSLSLRFVFSILKVITNACILCYLLNSNVFFLRIINKCNNLNISSRRTKGQLISKGNFCVFNSPKKRTKKFYPSRLGQKLTFSSSFFGRIKDTKISFRD